MFTKFRLTKEAMRIAIILAIAFGLSGAYYVKASGMLAPGPLSAVSISNEPLGGAMSHADIQRQCSHCHAPLHCVTDTRCQDCHMDIAQERDDTTTLHGRLPGVSRCQNCHPEHRGENASLTVLSYMNVDHYQLAGFSLDKHILNYDGENFSCTTCHSQDGDQINTVDCVTCHAGEDHDYIAQHIDAYGLACADCHDGRDRMLVGFDHDSYFSLQDGHAVEDCEVCHTDQATGVQVWQDLPAACADCHPEPELHASIFGSSCERCHTAVAWSPAELTEHTFVLEHGDDNDIAQCENCHGGTYTEYPCGTCHENGDMVSAHTPEGIDDLTDCITCHPTGRGSYAVDPNNASLKGSIP